MHALVASTSGSTMLSRRQAMPCRVRSSSVVSIRRCGSAVRPVAAQPDRESTSTATAEYDECDTNLGGEYCSIDRSGRRASTRTLGEMEQEFLEALSSFYYDGQPKLSDEEFELLREELYWNGSKVATLDSDEQRFLEVSQAYAAGKQILSDDEFDELKAKLRNKNSVVTAQGPRCSIRSKKMYSDATVDYLKMTAINIPAALLVLGLVFSIDDLTGFEITEFIELPPPYGILGLWGFLLPVVFLLSTSITNIVLRNGIILRGPCPSCGTINGTYFGDIFTVQGNRGANLVECSNCKADLTYDISKRIIVVDVTPEEKQKKLAAAAAKKAASAAKKAARAKSPS